MRSPVSAAAINAGAFGGAASAWPATSVPSAAETIRTDRHVRALPAVGLASERRPTKFNKRHGPAAARGSSGIMGKADPGRETTENMLTPPPAAPARARPVLERWHAVSVCVGMVIGAGVFITTPLAAANLPSAGWVIAAWVFGGAMSLAGALCFARWRPRSPTPAATTTLAPRLWRRRGLSVRLVALRRHPYGLDGAAGVYVRRLLGDARAARRARRAAVRRGHHSGARGRQPRRRQVRYRRAALAVVARHRGHVGRRGGRRVARREPASPPHPLRRPADTVFSVRAGRGARLCVPGLRRLERHGDAARPRCAMPATA